MITVTHNNIIYECTVAIKGADYIHLLDKGGYVIKAFTGVTDFSSFVISGGAWTTPTDAYNCYVDTLGSKCDNYTGKQMHWNLDSFDYFQNFLEQFLQSDAFNDYLLKHKFEVGDIYTTTNPGMNTAAKVAAKFGGTWVAWGTGRVPVGVDSSQTEFDEVEKTGGEKTHTLTVDEMPSHEHDVSGTAASGGAHTHDVSGKAADVSGHTHPVSGSAATGGGHSHGTGNSTLAHFQIQQNSKVSRRNIGSSGKGYQWTTDSTSDYSAVSAVSATSSHAGHTHSVSGTASSAGGHSHTVSGTAASDGAHEHSVSGTAAATGGGEAHNNLQPYITCYMWKRTA